MSAARCSGSGKYLLLVLLSSYIPASAQSAPALTAVGYQDPRLLIVAPGQVITFFITGASIVLPHPDNQDAMVTADQLPLPTSLAGFSVGLSQLGFELIPLPPFSMGPILLPIFSIEQTNHCLNAQTPDCFVTAITVEILPELQMPIGLNLTNYTTVVTVMENGVAGNQFGVSVLPVNPHVLTLCDSSYTSRPGIEANNSNCPSIITHADGSLVNPDSPAQPGETVVIYAFGLGPTVPPVPAGTATPMSLISTVVPYALLFAYRGATVAAGTLASSPPLFAGLTPGQVGLYQINFTVPSPSAMIADCSSPDGANLIVTLYNSIGYPYASGAIVGQDSARLCVVTGTTSSMLKEGR
jgi:uncharacterized protein (TIGR03437 family)